MLIFGKYAKFSSGRIKYALSDDPNPESLEYYIPNF